MNVRKFRQEAEAGQCKRSVVRYSSPLKTGGNERKKGSTNLKKNKKIGAMSGKIEAGYLLEKSLPCLEKN